ncbi:MAG: hypothetical protein PHU44_12355 [Syntrophales bacterium]|nr:hypothetical protein [Syntrophales bacterium]
MQIKTWKKAVLLMFAILLSWGFFPAPGDSADATKIYTDKFGYFSITPPQGWVRKDYPKETRARVRFTSPDDRATVGIIVRPVGPKEATFAKMLADKRLALENMRKKKPQGKYSLRESTICGYKCIRVDTEYPGQRIQENYLFTGKGLHVNFCYGAVDRGSLEKYRKTAMDSFCTIKLTGKK